MVEQVPGNYGNLEQEVYLTRTFLHFCGLWPGTSYLHFFSILIFIFVILWLPFIAYLHIFFRESIEDVIESTSYLLSVTSTFITMFIVRCNETSITTIVQHMSDNWHGMASISNEDKKIIHKKLLSSKFIVRFTFSFVFFCATIYSTMPYAIAAILGRELPRKAARVAWYPFPLDNFIVIALSSVLTVMAVTLDTLIDAAIDAFLIMSVYHCSGQLSLLCTTINKYRGVIRHSIDNLTTGSSSKSYKTSCPCLKCIVDHHVDIDLFVEEINNYANNIIFCKASVTVIKFCAMGFFVVQSAQTKNISGIIIHVLYIFWSGSSLIICCWLGEKLNKKSEDVERAICEIDWSIKKSKQSRSLMLIIIRSRKPFAITAGKIFTMNLLFCKECILASMSYLSVLIAIGLGDTATSSKD